VSRLARGTGSRVALESVSPYHCSVQGAASRNQLGTDCQSIRRHCGISSSERPSSELQVSSLRGRRSLASFAPWTPSSPFLQGLRACASGSSASASSSSSSQNFWEKWRKPEETPRQLLRVKALVIVRAEASHDSDELNTLAEGDLVETASGIDITVSTPEGGWLLVRVPLEDRLDVMSDKPLSYQDGWVAIGPDSSGEQGISDSGAVANATESKATLVPAELQLNQKVAAIVTPETHPVLQALEKYIYKEGVPQWMKTSVAELYTGRIAGVAIRGRFVLQRPSGAMPERIATAYAKFLLPRRRFKRTAVAGIIGFFLSISIGCGLHGLDWMHGISFEIGRSAAVPLIQWLTLITVFLTPLAIIPCFIFANSEAATCCAVAFMNLLLYNDLFAN